MIFIFITRLINAKSTVNNIKATKIIQSITPTIKTNEFNLNSTTLSTKLLSTLLATTVKTLPISSSSFKFTEILSSNQQHLNNNKQQFFSKNNQKQRKHQQKNFLELQKRLDNSNQNKVEWSCTQIQYPTLPSFQDQLTRVIYTLLMPVVCVLGAIGAAICILVFTRRQMRSSLSIYLAGLSTFDFLLLLMSLMIYPSMNLCMQEVHY